MREEVTQRTCQATLAELFVACQAFFGPLNADPDAVVTRLRPRFELDSEHEELRIAA